MSAIERLRYYDGEYLRSFDWESEQNYHVTMRRRLNRMLHLHGIVDGLEIQVDPDSTPNVQFYSISKGMAIDQFGREIVLDAPYLLRPEIVLARKEIEAGEADVWLCYREIATTPASAGYRVCNEPNQNTRWREGFDVVIVPPNKKPTGPQDPDAGRGGVFLGHIHIVARGGGFDFGTDDPNVAVFRNADRKFVGIRAQSIESPAGYPPFDVLAENAFDTPLASLEVKPNAFFDRNMIVGDDFGIDAAKVQPPITPATFPKAGVAKIGGALFVAGDAFVRDAGIWYVLKNYINHVIPEIVVGTADVTTVAGNADPSSGKVTLNLTSTRLAKASALKVMVAIQSYTRLSLNDYLNWAFGANQADPSHEWVFQLVPGNPIQDLNAPENWQVDVEWRIGPTETHDHLLPITKFTLSYVAVFQP